MRVLPALALGVLACTPSAPAPAGRAAPTPAPASVRFAASGQSTAVPADFRDLEPARVDALRASAEREQPTATVTIAGKRAPEGLGHGMVYLQRGEAPREPTTRPRSVEATLDRMAADLVARLAAEGLDVQRQDLAIAGDALDGTIIARMTRDNRTIETRLHLRITVPDARRIVTRSLGCMADNWHAESVCGPIFAAHTFDPEPTLPRSEPLPANAEQRPLPGVGPRSVDGVAFGATRDEFITACRDAGFDVDRIDPAAHPPHVLTWYAEGRMVRCAGLPPPASGPRLDLGRVVEVNAVLVDGRVAVVSLDLDADVEPVAARLSAAYPDIALAPTRVLHTIAEDATGDDLLRVGLDESGVPGARSAVHFVSRRGADGPPVEIPDAP